MTADDPQTCPVCNRPYDKREQFGSSATLDSPAHSRKCVQRFGTKLDVYYHRKIPIKLGEAGEA